MSDFALYLRLGFDHILDWQGYDHMLFLLVLVLPFSLGEWRRWAVLVTAFTLGHSLTLGLVALNVFQPPSKLVELAIALSIFVSGVLAMVQTRQVSGLGLRYALALCFGLIHGMGFSGYFRSLLGTEESILKPLLYFNLGIEAGQLLFVVGLLGMNAVLGRVMGEKAMVFWRRIVALAVVVLSAWMVVERGM
jgi:hypothetical protein